MICFIERMRNTYLRCIQKGHLFLILPFSHVWGAGEGDPLWSQKSAQNQHF